MFKKILYGILIVAIIVILAMMWKEPKNKKADDLNQNLQQMNLLDEQQDQEILNDLDSMDQQMLSDFDNDMKSIDMELNNL